MSDPYVPSIVQSAKKEPKEMYNIACYTYRLSRNVQSWVENGNIQNGNI